MIRAALVLGICVGIAAGCGDSGPSKTIAELQDPSTCMECHPV